MAPAGGHPGRKVGGQEGWGTEPPKSRKCQPLGTTRTSGDRAPQIAEKEPGDRAPSLDPDIPWSTGWACARAHDRLVEVAPTPTRCQAPFTGVSRRGRSTFRRPRAHSVARAGMPGSVRVGCVAERMRSQRRSHLAHLGFQTTSPQQTWVWSLARMAQVRAKPADTCTKASPAGASLTAPDSSLPQQTTVPSLLRIPQVWK